jgi:hypothetical protein
VRVSQCEDLAAALKAGQWLVEYGERLMKGKQGGRGNRVYVFAERVAATAGI